VCDNSFSINIARTPFSIKNYFGYWELKTLVKINGYAVIHCHTPTGALLARLAARKTNAKIIYTVHGFHFYKGAPFFYWLFFYLAEKYLAKYTDCLITLNREDYLLARKKFNIPIIKLIDGVGIDLSRFHPVTAAKKQTIRKSYNYNPSQFIILYTAELIPRKNHRWFINRLDALKKEIHGLKIIFAGIGGLGDKLVKLIKRKGLQGIVDFAGYRHDIEFFYQLADIHVSASRQEGLSVNNIEAMASGIPVVASKIRGHTDTIRQERNGFLFSLSRPQEMIDAVVRLYRDPRLRAGIARNNRSDAARFSEKRITKQILECYYQVLASQAFPACL
jgi:glycosyltransferase EpsD